MQSLYTDKELAVVVVLDEIGLAEDSKELPLKILHRLQLACAGSYAYAYFSRCFSVLD